MWVWNLVCHINGEHRLRVFGGRYVRLSGNCRPVHSENCTECSSGDHIKKNEMGGVFSTYGREERCTQGFGGERPEGKRLLEEPLLDGRLHVRTKTGCRLRSVPHSPLHYVQCNQQLHCNQIPICGGASYVFRHFSTIFS